MQFEQCALSLVLYTADDKQTVTVLQSCQVHRDKVQNISCV